MNRFRVVMITLVVGTLMAAIATLAVAQDPTPSPSAPSEAAPDRPPRGGSGLKGHGPGHFGHGIHGEFVTPAPNGGYQTVATQVGEVTAVDQATITLNSEDGFSRTYAVDENTLVNAGRDGIASVEVGDSARVMAIVTDGTARAVEIIDVTKVQRSREQWAPGRGANDTPLAPPTTTG